MIIETLSIILGSFGFFKAVRLASGHKTKKIFESETFLLWQKILAVYYLAVAVYFLFSSATSFFWFHIASLVLVGLFYLQPTPRIAKQLSVGFTMLNLIALIYIFS